MGARSTLAASPAPSVRSVPAVASLAVQPIVAGELRDGVVLGATTHAVWIDVAGDVVVLSTSDATRLPNSVEVPLPANALTLAAHAWVASVGRGRVTVGDLTASAVRWWDPRPAMSATTRRDLADAVDGLADDVEEVDPTQLRSALRSWSSADFSAAVRAVLGAGSGLTPVADDYVAGIAATIRCLAPALGHTSAIGMLDDAAPRLIADARDRTTAFSASLIRHAVFGNVAMPAAELLRALTGRGDVAAAHIRLSGVGHTSGPALAAGIALGTRALIEGDEP